MSSQEDVFSQEWAACLRAHYMHVIRTRDEVTEPSLTKVLRDVGFTDAELKELRVRATMYADEMPDDFLPDMNVLGEAEAALAVYPVPALPDEAEGEDEPEMLTEADEFESLVDAFPEAEAGLSDAPPMDDADAPEDDPDAPQQLSLF